jgi:hypothetical protein
MSFFGGYADALQFNEQQRLREQADKRAERELAIRETDAIESRRMNDLRYRAAQREEDAYKQLGAIPTHRDAPMLQATPSYFQAMGRNADGSQLDAEQAEVFARIAKEQPEWAAQFMQGLRAENVPGAGNVAYRSQVGPDGAVSIGQAEQVRRNDREIAGDRARILASGGLGIQGITASEDHLSRVVARHKQELETNFNKISANPALSDADKAMQYAQLLSEDRFTPGSFQIAPNKDGKFVLSYYNPETGTMNSAPPRTLEEIKDETLKAINVENYIRLRQDRRAEGAEGRAQALAPAQLRTANVAADVAEGTKGAQIAAGNLAPQRVQAEIAQKQAWVATVRQTEGQKWEDRIGALSGVIRQANPSVSEADARQLAAQQLTRDPEARGPSPTDIINFIKESGDAVVGKDQNTGKPIRLRDLPLEQQTNMARGALGRQVGGQQRPAGAGALPDFNPGAAGPPAPDPKPDAASAIPMSRSSESPSVSGVSNFGPLSTYPNVVGAAEAGDQGALRYLADQANDPYKLMNMPNDALRFLAEQGNAIARSELSRRLTAQ